MFYQNIWIHRGITASFPLLAGLEGKPMVLYLCHIRFLVFLTGYSIFNVVYVVVRRLPLIGTASQGCELSQLTWLRVLWFTVRINPCLTFKCWHFQRLFLGFRNAMVMAIMVKRLQRLYGKIISRVTINTEIVFLNAWYSWNV